MQTLYKVIYTDGKSGKTKEDICETLEDVSSVIRKFVYDTDRSQKTGNRFSRIETVDASLYTHHGDGFYTLTK